MRDLVLSRSERALLERIQKRQVSLSNSAPWRTQIRSCMQQRLIVRRGVVYHLTSRGAARLAGLLAHVQESA